MKDKLKKMLIEKIEKWDVPDIYAISLWVQDEDDNPYKPTVTLGYNTESQVQKIL